MRLLITAFLVVACVAGASEARPNYRKYKPKPPPPPDRFDVIEAKVYCEDRIKALLRDPDSYKFEKATIDSTSGQHSQWGIAVVSFRAKNGFGGYTRSLARCEKFPVGDTAWFRAEIL